MRLVFVGVVEKINIVWENVLGRENDLVEIAPQKRQFPVALLE